MASEERYSENEADDETAMYQREFVIGGTDSETGPWTTGTYRETLADVVTSNYRSKIAAGQIINNPCVMTVDSLTSTGSGSANYTTGPTYEYNVYGPITIVIKDWLGSGFWDDIVAPTLPYTESRLKAVALANIDNTPYAFGEDALELKETLRFLRNPVSGLLKLSRAYYRAFRRRRYQSTLKSSLYHAETVATTTAGIWLQFRFAVSPLVRSSIDALEAFSAVVTTPPTRQTARGIGQFFDQQVGEFVNGTWSFDKSYSLETSSKASVLYIVRNPIHDWRYKLGFRVKDLPTTVWQIMPYSFMVDRMYDLTSFSKGVINMLDPNVRILAASYRTKTEELWNYKLASNSQPGYTLHNAEQVEEKSFVYRRDVWKPTFADAVPQFTPGYLVDDATKIADAVSLILSNFRGILPRNLI